MFIPQQFSIITLTAPDSPTSVQQSRPWQLILWGMLLTPSDPPVQTFRVLIISDGRAQLGNAGSG